MFDGGVNLATLLIVAVIGSASLVSAKWISENQFVAFAIQCLRFFGIGVIANTTRYYLLYPAFKIFTSDCMVRHAPLGRYSIILTLLLGIVPVGIVPIVEYFVLSRETLKARNQSKTRALYKVLEYTDST